MGIRTEREIIRSIEGYSTRRMDSERTNLSIGHKLENTHPPESPNERATMNQELVEQVCRENLPKINAKYKVNPELQKQLNVIEPEG